MTEAYRPPPVPSLSTLTCTWTSVSVEDTPARDAVRFDPRFSRWRAAAPSTENSDAEPVVVHAPPTSALPQPPVTVRVKASCARAGPTGVGFGAVTVTDAVVEPVAPSSSVTVSFTVYVPAC